MCRTLCLKAVILSALVLTAIISTGQTKYINPSEIYSFEVPKGYNSQKSNHVRNEFVFVSNSDTTSLVVNVNTMQLTANYVKEFKQATNAEIEKHYFQAVQNPNIVLRGEVESQKDKSIFFHITHDSNSASGNDYMMTYLFYHKDHEIAFIFRSKQRRLSAIIERIDEIVKSVALL